MHNFGIKRVIPGAEAPVEIPPDQEPYTRSGLRRDRGISLQALECGAAVRSGIPRHAERTATMFADHMREQVSDEASRSRSARRGTREEHCLAGR